MDMQLKEKFLSQWDKYFNGNELPFTLMYTNTPNNATKMSFDSEHNCLISIISHVRSGRNIYFDADSVNCSGARQSLGFETQLNYSTAYLFSNCNISSNNGKNPKKDFSRIPEWIKQLPRIQAPESKGVFKRWDRLEATDNPEIVIFFAEPNELSALLTLANFYESSPHTVNLPYCTACASLTLFPLKERYSKNPKPVMGMLNVSSRPYVPQTTISFAVPFNKFESMVHCMENSFLTTDTWQKAQMRLTSPSAQKYQRLRCHF